MIYLIIFTVGVFIGAFIGLVAAGLCLCAKKSENAIFQSYYSKEKQKYYGE